ncbi:MAG TPA: hypothetical protein OIM42_03990 [Clostridiaceae bacterium]|jgi:hypothetical protein|nr:hypothetical protein [Clostridiaceae bacterium]HJJ14007.1 hypothetical protein [Clostridiaceae bacterium]
MDYDKVEIFFDEAMELLNAHCINSITAMDESNNMIVVKNKDRTYIKSKEHDVDLMMISRLKNRNFNIYIKDIKEGIKVRCFISIFER